MHAHCFYAVLGRSIVVYGTGKQRGELLGCANIEPSLKEDIDISFPRNSDSNPEDIDRCISTFTHKIMHTHNNYIIYNII